MITNKRDDVLDAALILFAERGFDGTTIPMIADKAKVGAGTIYRYFENKEALFNWLFQYWVTRLSEIVKDNFPNDLTNIRLHHRHIFFQIIQFVNHNEHALHFIDSHCSAHYLDEKSQKLFADFLEFLRSILERGKKQGDICSMPADALIAIVYGAIVQLFKLMRMNILEETPELLVNIEKCCWNAIKAH
ncbi:TetR/AcrR family transcriptional regulator [Peribacillus asahii]|uniref:TetR/AcrR family transcriptional regulator n=1 Tax=Peribacillus asahii TaxID=228899 RepID=UPI0038257CE5